MADLSPSRYFFGSTFWFFLFAFLAMASEYDISRSEFNFGDFSPCRSALDSHNDTTSGLFVAVQLESRRMRRWIKKA